MVSEEACVRVGTANLIGAVIVLMLPNITFCPPGAWRTFALSALSRTIADIQLYYYYEREFGGRKIWSREKTHT